MNTQHEERDLRARSISTTAESGSFQSAVLAHIASLAYPAPSLFGVRLALEEALVNAIHHGNGDDPDKKVWIIFQIGTQAVEFVIIDEGAGYNPAAVPNPTTPKNIEDPRGRGLLLMRTYMEECEWRGSGNIVRLRRTKDWQPAAVV